MPYSISCTDQEIKSIIVETIDFLFANGGYINPDIEFRCIDGSISAHSLSPIPANTLLLHVPDICLPFIKDFSLTLVDDEIVVGNVLRPLPEVTIQAMSLVIKFFNATKKIQSHKKESIYLYLFAHYPKIFDAIYSVIYSTTKPLDPTSQEGILYSFLKSRRMSYTKNSDEETGSVLLPVLDWFNHSQKSNPVMKLSTSDVTGLAIVSANTSNECTFCYSRFDGLGSTFQFGFYDNTSNFIRSIPTTIPLGNISISVISRGTKDLDANLVPDVAKDLAEIFPAFGIGKNGIVQLSHLIIPNKSRPRSLRRILEICIRNIMPDIKNKSEIEALIKSSEEFIINVNRDFYLRLATQIEEISNQNVKNTLSDMIQGSLAIIDNYCSFSKNLPLSYLNYD